MQKLRDFKHNHVSCNCVGYLSAMDLEGEETKQGHNRPESDFISLPTAGKGLEMLSNLLFQCLDKGSSGRMLLGQKLFGWMAHGDVTWYL